MAHNRTGDRYQEGRAHQFREQVSDTLGVAARRCRGRVSRLGSNGSLHEGHGPSRAFGLMRALAAEVRLSDSRIETPCRRKSVFPHLAKSERDVEALSWLADPEARLKAPYPSRAGLFAVSSHLPLACLTLGHAGCDHVQGAVSGKCRTFLPTDDMAGVVAGKVDASLRLDPNLVAWRGTHVGSH